MDDPAATVTGKCTGNTDASEDVDCSTGDGTTATNTQNKGSSETGADKPTCCEAREWWSSPAIQRMLSRGAITIIHAA
jgi:hypothetical protein